jgi:hypothetical protein
MKNPETDLESNITQKCEKVTVIDNAHKFFTKSQTVIYDFLES